MRKELNKLITDANRNDQRRGQEDLVNNRTMFTKEEENGKESRKQGKKKKQKWLVEMYKMRTTMK